MKKANYVVMTPGPTTVRENVKHSYTYNYGNSDFDENFFICYEKLCKKIGKIWGAKKAQTIIISGEGMAGLDAACASMTEKGDKVLVLSNGIFGRGFKDLVENYGGEVTLFETDPKYPIDIDKLRVFLEKNKDINFKYATVVHCDTPSGVLNDVEKICKTLKSAGIMTVVDTVSAMGGTKVCVDDWGIDIALGATQKALSSNTGLSILSISDKAWEVILNRKTKIPSFFCNISLWKDCIPNRLFPYTIPIHDIAALDVAVDNIFEEGLQNVIDRHYKMAEFTRQKLMELDIELYLKDGYSPTVTAFYVPKGYDLEEIFNVMKDKHEVMIAKNYGDLKKDVLRIGHMGENARYFRMRYTLDSLGKTLKELKK